MLLRLVAVTALLVAACDDPRQGKSFYDREIAPILITGCAGNTSGCHAVSPDDPFQVAAGNFDVTSFDNVQKRRDLLQPFGVYDTPALLIKAAQSGGVRFDGPSERAIQIAYGGGARDLQVLHTGGAIFEVDSEAYRALLSWVQAGANEDGVPRARRAEPGDGPCSTEIPAGFDPAEVTGNPTFAEFQSQVAPLLEGCAAGSCHGAPQSDFYITCGDDDAQRAFNFKQAWSFVADPADDSQLLRVPLALAEGGGPHTGGDQLPSRTSGAYETIKAWAEKVGPLEFGAGDPGRQFFAANVQPVLLQRGCAFQACHSPAAANDFKLRPGAGGFYSPIALERNYQVLRDDFMALEFPDARRGRAVAKTIDPSRGGIVHRAKAVLETPGRPADPATCPTTYDPATATAFCTIQKWLDIERAALIDRGELTALAAGEQVPIVYVQRSASDVAGPLQFDTYQRGADLRVAAATLGAGGAIASVGAGTSLLGGCGVADLAAVDVRSPDVNLDGDSVAFAMRTSASDPLGIYVVKISDRSCRRITPAAPDVGGIKIHDFDPAWSPDGASIVFASTRGGAAGPSRSRKLFLPQSDLWRMSASGDDVEQLTFLTNSEIQPQMMREGRITMTTEKVSPGFYQLAGRRLNWDRTDYHPLLAQRATSLYPSPDDLTGTRPSVGYQQATDIREGADGNFLLILSDAGARGGAGSLAIFNRSIGTFEQDRADAGYVAAMTRIDPAATGRVGTPTTGAYRSPVSLPDGRIMVSYAAFAGDLGAATALDWDVVAIDPRSGTRTPLIGGDGAQVEAVLAIKRPRGKVYLNRRQLVFGGGADGGLGDRAVLHFPDAPMAFTVLTGNLRRGRPIEAFRAARRLAVYEEQLAGAGTTSGNQPDGIFQTRRLLGTAALRADGSAKVSIPAGRGLVLELQDGDGNPVVTMGEEHQLGPGERVSLGVSEKLFDAVCAGCHGSVSGQEIDVIVTPDALTGASQSASLDADPVSVGD